MNANHSYLIMRTLPRLRRRTCGTFHSDLSRGTCGETAQHSPQHSPQHSAQHSGQRSGSNNSQPGRRIDCDVQHGVALSAARRAVVRSTASRLAGAAPWAAAALLALGTPCAAVAQGPATADAQLPAVTVSASRREQAVRHAPATVTVVTRQDLDAKPFGSVLDVLGSVEGVSVVGANPNDRDVVLRGMPGEYTLILVDGRRQNTRETMNRGTGGVQANLLPPLAAIERIEVVRGPMSSLYGADAMGGVINIITRKQPEAWRGAVAANAVLQQEGTHGDSRGLDFWVGGPLAGEAIGLQLSGRAARRDEDDVYYPLNATSGANGQRDARLDAKLSARLTPSQDLSFDIGREQFTYLSTPGLTLADTAAPSVVRETRHRRDHAGLAHEGRWAWGRSNLSVSQETGYQVQWNGLGRSPVEPEARNTQFDGTAVVPWWDGNDVLTVGTQLRRERLSDVAAQDAVPAGYVANPDTVRRNSWALFAENDHAFSPAFTLTTGVRLDHDERYGNHTSPRIYGVYKLDPLWTLRGGLASGFKAPSLRQSTGGYCMTTGGAAGAVAGTLCGRPALEPETSFTQEIGLRRDAGGDHVALTVFNNNFKNKVASYDTGVPDPAATGRNLYIYDNIARVRLMGFELSAGAPLAAGWRVSGNYAYTRSRREGGGENAFDGTSLDGRPLDKAPRHKLRVQADWQARPDLGLYAALDHSGKQHWAAFRNGAVNQRERGATTTFDLGGRYALNGAVDVKLAVQNLSDRRLTVDPRARTAGLDGNWMVDEGRRLAITVGAEF